MPDLVDTNKEGQDLTPGLDKVQAFYREKDGQDMRLKALPARPETYKGLPEDTQRLLYGKDEDVHRIRAETTSTIEGLASKNEELTEKSRIDALTGLENRRSFGEGIVSAVNRANRIGSRIFLVMIDIDFFKKVNDSYGHPAGDYVLREFAGLLKAGNLLRKSEKPFRYGGEEFAIIVDGDPADPDVCEKVINLCDRVRTRVEQHEFVFNGKRIPVTISLGVADFDGVKEKKDVVSGMKIEQKAKLDDEGVRKLVDLADSALYAAKGQNGNGGRNRTVLADEEKDPIYKQHVLNITMARG